MEVDRGFVHVWEEPTEVGRRYNLIPAGIGCSLLLLAPTCWLKNHKGLEKLDHFDLHSVSGDVSRISTAIRVKGGCVEGQDLVSVP